MKKTWTNRLAAVSLILAIGTGTGTILKAKEEKDVNSGGGVRSSRNNL